jgi:DNA invertase Pin-like site-specific DNA recombinase
MCRAVPPTLSAAVSVALPTLAPRGSGQARPPFGAGAVPGTADTVGYRRVSKGEQAEDWKSSLATQTAKLCALAERHGRLLDREHVFEDRFSGEDARDRPGFLALVRHCELHPRRRAAPGLLVVATHDRFGRFEDRDEAGYWRKRLRDAGWVVRYASADDTDDPNTRHILNAVNDSTAAQERTAIKTRAVDGARGAAARGHWLCEAPFGYRREARFEGRPSRVLDVGERKSDDCYVVLVPHAAEAEGVRWMFETYGAGGVSLESVAAEMARRFPDRLKWSKQALAGMLRNSTYLGMVIHGRRPHDKHERAETRVRPADRWVVRERAHAALVAPSVFAAVGGRLEANKRERARTEGGYPLSGLLVCSRCGEPYIGGGGKRGPADDPDYYRFYRDRGAERVRRGTEVTVRCPGRMGIVMRRDLEAMVLGALGETLGDPRVQAALAAALDARLGRRGEDLGSERARLEAALARVAGERARLVRAVARGTMTDDEAAPALAEARAEAADVEGRLVAVREAEGRAPSFAAERDRLLASARAFPELARTLPAPGVRELVATWLESGVVDQEARTITVVARLPAGPDGFLSSSTPGRG